MADVVIRERSFVVEDAIAEAEPLVFWMDVALGRIDEGLELGYSGSGGDSDGNVCEVGGVLHEDLHGEPGVWSGGFVACSTSSLLVLRFGTISFTLLVSLHAKSALDCARVSVTSRIFVASTCAVVKLEPKNDAFSAPTLPRTAKRQGGKSHAFSTTRSNKA